MNKINEIRTLQRIGQTSGVNSRTPSVNSRTPSVNSNTTATDESSPNLPQYISPFKENIVKANDLEYINNGSYYISNNKYVHNRDTKGNIIINDNQSNIIFEPVTKRYYNKSVVNTLDTQFRYFSFPATVNENNLNGNVLAPNLTEEYNVTYTLPSFVDSLGQNSGLLRINTSFESTWFSNNAEDRRQGFARLPYSGLEQEEIGRFTITKKVLDLLNSEPGKTLKFKIKAQFITRDPSVITIVGQLKRTTPRNFRTSPLARFTTQANISPSQNRYNFDTTNGFSNEFPYFDIEYYVTPGDWFQEDFFEFEVVAGSRAWVYTDNAYWNVTIEDAPSINRNIRSILQKNVFQMGPNIRLTSPNTSAGDNELARTNRFGEFIR